MELKFEPENPFDHSPDEEQRPLSPTIVERHPDPLGADEKAGT